MNHIYKQRQGYIRLQLQSHLGLSPGSMAVLQVWPPFNCSPIHNHGDADGMIKVVSGTIHVQNFSQLSFNNIENGKAFQQKDYCQDEYTWLSQYSFGIHRLVNLHNQTCLSLQSYYNNDNDTKQYFSFIEGNKKEGYSYSQYYPQNDWKNYLFWSKPKQNPKAKDYDKDYKFIQDVIRQYGLNSDLTKHQLQGQLTENPHIDWSFQRLAMVMRQQYQYAINFDHQQHLQKQHKNVILWLYDQKTEFQKASQKVIDHYGKDNIQIQSANDFETYLNLVSQGVKTLGKRIALVANVTQYENPNSNASVSLQVLKQLERLVGLGCTLAVALHDRLSLKSSLKVYGSNSLYVASSLDQFFKLTPWSPQ